MMLRQDLKKSFYISYIIISIILLLIVLGVFILPTDFVFQISSLLKIEHTTACPLCGLSSAFIEISHGNFSAENQMNPVSFVLFFFMCLNSMILFVLLTKHYLGKKVKLIWRE